MLILSSGLNKPVNDRISRKSQNKTAINLYKIPPNYGQKYNHDFSASYAVLAKQHKIKLVPFLLDGVAGKPSLIQDDGLHPLAAAQPALLENVWVSFNRMLK